MSRARPVTLLLLGAGIAPVLFSWTCAACSGSPGLLAWIGLSAVPLVTCAGLAFRSEARLAAPSRWHVDFHLGLLALTGAVALLLQWRIFETVDPQGAERLRIYSQVIATAWFVYAGFSTATGWLWGTSRVKLVSLHALGLLMPVVSLVAFYFFVAYGPELGS